MYARFVAWFKARFIPELERRNGWYWPPLMQAKLDAFRAECAEKVGRANRANEVVDLLRAEGDGEFVLKPRLRELTRVGRIRSLSGQLKEGEHECDSTSFSNNWNEYRLRLQYHHGYRDTGLEAGHLKAT